MKLAETESIKKKLLLLQLGFALFLGARGGGSKLLLQRFNQLLLATPRSCWKLPP